MSSTAAASAQRPSKTVIGQPDNFWLWSLKKGYDWTHPFSPDSAPLKNALRLQCAIENISIDPKKTALVAVDFQIFVLEKARKQMIGPEISWPEKALMDQAIPAARKAGIQVI